MCPKDVDRIVNIVDADQTGKSSLIWVTVLVSKPTCPNIYDHNGIVYELKMSKALVFLSDCTTEMQIKYNLILRCSWVQQSDLR